MQVILENLYQAYYNARQNKRNTKEQLLFEVAYETNLHQLYTKILNKTYKTASCKAFVIEKPVYREIFAPQFIDRVVHHFVAQYIIPPMEASLIDDAYSCRVGKGTLYGIKRVNYFMRSITQNYAKDAYVLKLDIAGYFMNMNRDILYKQIIDMQLVTNSNASALEKEYINYLIKEIIYNAPAENCVRKGNKKLWKYIPNSKSLFHSPKNCGLPIGNLTSQLFGNIYLNEFDHWVKNKLGIQYYGRYVDDMVFMHPNKEVLKQHIKTIATKLQSFGLTVHPKKIYLQHYTKGVSFLGQFIKPYRCYITNRTKNNFKKTIIAIEHQLTNLTINNTTFYNQLCNIRARINSYWGLFCKANSYHFLHHTMQQFSTLFYTYFYFEKYKTTWKCKIKNKYKPTLNGIILQPTSL